MNKPKKPKLKRYTLTLTELDVYRLNAYAESSGIDRPTALHRLMKQSLRQVDAASIDRRDANQLGLFDTLQIDIFNNTSKVE
ncbi:MAG: hypothetical protein ACSW8I_02215 [bacterium]